MSSETPCSYNVRLGSRNWLSDKEGHHVDRTVQDIYRHPDYGTFVELESTHRVHTSANEYGLIRNVKGTLRRRIAYIFFGPS